MKKKLLQLGVACFLTLILSAIAAEAQVANFQGSTLLFSRHGDFRDNGSTCPGGASPTQFQWTFADEGVIRFGNPVTHQFTAGFCAETVQLKITCPGGSTATSTRFACLGCCTSGGIFPDFGYN